MRYLRLGLPPGTSIAPRMTATGAKIRDLRTPPNDQSVSEAVFRSALQNSLNLNEKALRFLRRAQITYPNVDSQGKSL